MIEITPNPNCKLCHGTGEVYTGSVPYGSTWVSLPNDYCQCVIDQLPEDDDDSEEIILIYSEEVLKRWQEEKEPDFP